MEITVKNNPQKLRFEAVINAETAYLEYIYLKNDIALMHTFVPEELRGNGLAPAITKFAFQFAEENKLLVMIYCPFVAKYIIEHPEFNFLVAKIYRHRN